MDIRHLDQIDQSFDRYSVYVGVSSFSGAGRMVYGLAELVTGIAMGVISALGQTFTDDKKYERGLEMAMVHVFFGGANMVKAVFEVIPLVNFLVAGYNNAWGEYDGTKPLMRGDWKAFSAAPIQ